MRLYPRQKLCGGHQGIFSLVLRKAAIPPCAMLYSGYLLLFPRYSALSLWWALHFSERFRTCLTDSENPRLQPLKAQPSVFPSGYSSKSEPCSNRDVVCKCFPFPHLILVLFCSVMFLKIININFIIRDCWNSITSTKLPGSEKTSYSRL